MEKYLLIGDGRVARHFAYYLKSLQIPFDQWSRKLAAQKLCDSLEKKVPECTRVLLLIKDSAIDPFILENPVLKTRPLIHFSGALVSPFAASAHPLFAFSERLFDLKTYSEIPFVCEQEGPPFPQLLPGIPNPNYRVPRAEKPLYHALCVLAGGGSALLWDVLFRIFEERFYFPPSVGQSYLSGVVENLQSGTKTADRVTGPFVRGDLSTIEKNLKALREMKSGSDTRGLARVYEGLVGVYEKRS